MDNASLIQRLDERTERLIDLVDHHVEDDKQKFTAVFERLRQGELASARHNVIMAAIVIMAQIVLAAWIKGMFG